MHEFSFAPDGTVCHVCAPYHVLAWPYLSYHSTRQNRSRRRFHSAHGYPAAPHRTPLNRADATTSSVRRGSEIEPAAARTVPAFAFTMRDTLLQPECKRPSGIKPRLSRGGSAGSRSGSRRLRRSSHGAREHYTHTWTLSMQRATKTIYSRLWTWPWRHF